MAGYDPDDIDILTYLDMVYALVVDDGSPMVPTVTRREAIDEALGDVSPFDADEDEWGMSEEDEAAMTAWASQVAPTISPPDP